MAGILSPRLQAVPGSRTCLTQPQRGCTASGGQLPTRSILAREERDLVASWSKRRGGSEGASRPDLNTRAQPVFRNTATVTLVQPPQSASPARRASHPRTMFTRSEMGAGCRGPDAGTWAWPALPGERRCLEPRSSPSRSTRAGPHAPGSGARASGGVRYVARRAVRDGGAAGKDLGRSREGYQRPLGAPCLPSETPPRPGSGARQCREGEEAAGTE